MKNDLPAKENESSVIVECDLDEPPGELMYIAISFLGLSDSRKSSWALIKAETLSSIAPLRNTMRSRSKRENMSNERSPRVDCSITTGTRFIRPPIAKSSRPSSTPRSCGHVARADAHRVRRRER